MKTKYIYRYEKLRDLIKKVDKTIKMRCYYIRFNYGNYTTEHTKLEAILRFEYIHKIGYEIYKVELDYKCDAVFNMLKSNFEKLFLYINDDYNPITHVHTINNIELYKDYNSKLLDMNYILSESYTEMIDECVKEYNVSLAEADNYFKYHLEFDPEDPVNSLTVNKQKLLRTEDRSRSYYTPYRENKKEAVHKDKVVYDNSLGKHTIDKSVKVSISKTPENEKNRKVFDFIQVELPIYKMNLHNKEELDKVKAYVVERIAKDRYFKRYGVPVNILKCYSITRQNEFYTFKFEIKDIKRSK